MPLKSVNLSVCAFVEVGTQNSERRNSHVSDKFNSELENLDKEEVSRNLEPGNLNKVSTWESNLELENLDKEEVNQNSFDS